MREIKFRVWDGEKMLLNHEIKHYELGVLQGTSYKMMSCTGLLDKQGVDIYEGDIFYYHDHGGYVVVEYVLDMFHLKSLKLPKLSTGNYRLSTLHSKLEVIGNIYENPELLHNNLKDKK